ncbi:hypothetical protein BC941DRAFT_425835, partial [Chlamydoabsidia padenii]
MAKESTPSISEERIVPSSSQSSLKTTTTSTTGWIDSTPFSTVSFDQLSTYARRASNSSLSLLNVANVLPLLKSEDAEQKQVERIQKVERGTYRTLQLSLNDGSQGLSRINDHIHRRVPQLVDQRQQLNTLTEQVKTSNSDLKDGCDMVTSMERIESFVRMADMIQSSLELIESCN